MQYHSPTIPAIECSPLAPDNTPVLICPSCGDTMQHLRTIPHLGRVWNSSSLFALPANKSTRRKSGGVASREPKLAPVH
jgi:hypothetical protein